MNIGIVITRFGGVDGVSLETEKWIAVLERMGHDVFVITGELERPLPRVTIFSELGLYHPFCTEEQEAAFFERGVNERELSQLLEEHSSFLEQKIGDWMRDHAIDLLISQNVSALPCHLSAGMALARVSLGAGVSTLLHLHDFRWERGERYESPYPCVQEIMEECFPPKGEVFHHVVINTYNRKKLEESMGIQAVCIPNVMSFEEPFGKQDDYNADFLEEMGVGSDAFVLSQVTRIVERKGIETAIQLVDRLEDSRVCLLITGSAIDDRGGRYYEKLKGLVEERGLQKRVLFIGDRVDHWRHIKRGQKIYSLSDVYAHTKGCTYFSTYEGFGNAFVEACAAKTPIFVNDYEPVYWPDIGSKGFKAVTIQNSRLEPRHVESIEKILHDDALCQEIAEHNYALAKKHFSFDTLEVLLRPLIAEPKVLGS